MVVYVCTCICIWVYVSVCTWVYVYVSVCVYCVCVHVYVFECTCMHVSVCVCVCERTYRCMHTSLCVWKWEDNLGYQSSPSTLIETGSLLSFVSAWVSCPTVLQRSSHLCLPYCQRSSIHVGSWGFELSSSCMHSKHFSSLSHLSSPSEWMFSSYTSNGVRKG